MATIIIIIIIIIIINLDLSLLMATVNILSSVWSRGERILIFDDFKLNLI